MALRHVPDRTAAPVRSTRNVVAHHDAPGVNPDKSEDGPEQGGLSRPIRSKKSDEFTRPNHQINISQDRPSTQVDR